MTKYYDTNPTYAQLTPFKKCVIDMLAGRQLMLHYNASSKTSYPNSTNYLEAHHTLKTFQLAFLHIDDIVGELGIPTNKNTDILQTCAKEAAARSR